MANDMPVFCTIVHEETNDMNGIIRTIIGKWRGGKRSPLAIGRVARLVVREIFNEF